MKVPQSALVNELDSCLRSTFDCDDGRLSPLEFWKKNRQSFFPKLAQIAHSIYAIPTTQNKSERAFSAASHVMTELRTTLAIYIFILWFLLSFVFPRLNPLKFTGVARTRQQISAVSRPKFTILWGHVEDILLLNKFFPIVDSCKFIA